MLQNYTSNWPSLINNFGISFINEMQNMTMDREGDSAIYVVHYMRWFDGEMVVYKIDEV
jgi:hypothetical protein